MRVTKLVKGKIMQELDAIGLMATNVLIFALLERGPARFKDISSATKMGPKTITKILQKGVAHLLIQEELVNTKTKRGSVKGYALSSRGKEFMRMLRMLDVDIDSLVRFS
jgi:DNA-binding HxlR family transcriptional regulator